MGHHREKSKARAGGSPESKSRCKSKGKRSGQMKRTIWLPKVKSKEIYKHGRFGTVSKADSDRGWKSRPGKVLEGPRTYTEVWGARLRALDL